MTKRKPYVIDGIADIRDAVSESGRGCLARVCEDGGCVLFAWCPKASAGIAPDLTWVLRAKARERKLARDRARRAGR